jgi:hypothetical protein
MAMQKEVLNDLFKKTLQLLLSYEIDTVGYIGLEHSDPSLTKNDLRVKATRLVLISDIFRQVFKVVASDGKLSLQEQTVFIPLARNFLRCIKPMRSETYGDITDSDIKAFLTIYKSDSSVFGFNDLVQWRAFEILGQTNNLKIDSKLFCLYYKLLIGYVTFFVESSDDPNSSRIISSINGYVTRILNIEESTQLSGILKINEDSQNNFFDKQLEYQSMIDILKNYWIDLPDFINDEVWNDFEIISVIEGNNYKCQISVLLDFRKYDIVSNPNSGKLNYTRNKFLVNMFDLFSLDLPMPKEVVNAAKSFKIPESDYISCCSNCNETGKVKCKSCHGSKSLKCRTCDGQCKLRCGNCSGSGTVQKSKSIEAKVKCTLCLGTGRFPAFGPDSDDCNMCNGRGETWGRKTTYYTDSCSVCSSSGRVSCTTCSGSGRLICQECDPRGLIVCKKCNGYGTFHNYCVCVRELVIEEDFQSFSDILNGSNPLSGILVETDWNQVIIDEISESSSKPEVSHLYKEVSNSCVSLYNQLVISKNQNKNGRPLIKEILVYEEPLKLVEYKFDSKKYEIVFYPMCNHIYSVSSPFSDLIGTLITDAITSWSIGRKKDAKDSLLHAREIAETNDDLNKRYKELEDTIPHALVKYTDWKVPTEALVVIPILIILVFLIFLFNR